MTGPGRYRDDEQSDDYGDTPLDRLGFSSGPDPIRRASRGGPHRPRSHRLLVGAGAATALLLVVITATELVGHQSTPTGTPSSAADPRDLTGSPQSTAAGPSGDVPSAAPPVIPPAGSTVTVLPPPTGTQPTSLLPPTPPPPTPLLPEPSDPSTTSAPTTSEGDPPESTGAGGDQGSAGAAATTAAPTSSPEPTALPTRTAPPTRTRSPEPTPGAAAAGSAGEAPSSTVVPIPPSKPPSTGGAGADRASQPVVHIVRRPDGTSTITVTVGDTTIGPVTVPSDATTRVPNPPVSVAPQHTEPPTSTTPPTSTDAPDTTTPATQPPDTQTPVPGKAPPDLQTPDTASVSQPPGSDASGTAQGNTGSQQTPQTTVPGKAPVDGQTPETQTPETQTPETPPSDGQTTGGAGSRGSGDPDDTAGATGTGNGGGLAPDAGAPSTFEVIPSPGNDVQQAPARTRSRSSGGPANTIEPGGPVVGSEAALQPPVIVQTQVNLAESTPESGATDSRAAAGWFTAFALGALIAAGVIVAGLALRRRGDHGP